MVFHAGTASRTIDIVTAGGRVLGVTARGPDLGQASTALTPRIAVFISTACTTAKISAKGLRRYNSAESGT